MCDEHGGRIDAGAAVFATNSPTNDYLAMHSKQAPYRTYVTAFRVPSGSVPDALNWDTLDPYHYVRIQPGPGTTDYLIVGGEDHKPARQPMMGMCASKDRSVDHGAMAAIGKEVHCWSGQVMEPIDTRGIHRASIRAMSEYYVVTGDSAARA